MFKKLPVFTSPLESHLGFIERYAPLLSIEKNLDVYLSECLVFDFDLDLDLDFEFRFFFFLKF